MTQLSHSLQDTLSRLTAAPRRALDRVTGRNRFNPGRHIPLSYPPPAAVTTRLEAMFEALSDLGAQPHVAAAFKLACNALEALLPSDAIGAALYHIDTDELRFVTVSGPGRELVPDMAIHGRGCLSDAAYEQAVISTGAANSCWLGSAEADASVLMCPLRHETSLLGVLVLVRADAAATNGFTAHDLELVGYVAEQLGAFIHQQRNRSLHARRAELERGAHY